MVEIYTKYITLKNGKRLHASECGLNAFHFEVTQEEHEEYLNKKDETDK